MVNAAIVLLVNHHYINRYELKQHYSKRGTLNADKTKGNIVLLL